MMAALSAARSGRAQPGQHHYRHQPRRHPDPAQPRPADPRRLTEHAGAYRARYWRPPTEGDPGNVRAGVYALRSWPDLAFKLRS